jgi:hypothetical protein
MKSISDYPLLISAKILADSISPKGVRLTTMEIVCHRYVLAEFNTHRWFSRNSASSRAIPVEKTLDRFLNEWAVPLEWPSEQPGMSGGADLQGADLDEAQGLFQRIHHYVGSQIQEYLDDHEEKSTRLHKSVLNRLMEFGQWHTIIVSSTEWNNYFKLRASPQAQPEIRAVAEKMQEIYNTSIPTKLKTYEWHLPLFGFDGDEHVTGYDRVKLSVARCARVSYLTHDGIRDPEADYALFDKLKSNGHWSPLEHAAQAMAGRTGSGNFQGFKQSRYYEETGEEPGSPKPRKKKVKPKATAPYSTYSLVPNFDPLSGPYSYNSNTSYNNYSLISPVMLNPKVYFSSPQSRRLLVVAANYNDALRAMKDVEYELLKASSFFSYPLPSLKWDFAATSYVFRGIPECDVALVKGWESALGSSYIIDEMKQAERMGHIKTYINLR